jgi:hypothetical protein
MKKNEKIEMDTFYLIYEEIIYFFVATVLFLFKTLTRISPVYDSMF